MGLDLELLPVFLGALAVVLSGCASAPRPYRSGRVGFLDRENGALSDLHSERSRGPNSAHSKGKSESNDALVATAGKIPELKKGTGSWEWPLKKVQVTSKFGLRGKEFHEGIDLHAGIGTPVYAVESGTVLYAGGKIKGYGKMIVIRHPNGLSTVYAHNSRVTVMRGQTVQKGRTIGFTGRTGHVRGPHLHFEIRSGLTAIDPLQLLPNWPGRITILTRSSDEGSGGAIHRVIQKQARLPAASVASRE